MRTDLLRNLFRVAIAIALGLGTAVSEVRAGGFAAPATTFTVNNTNDSGAGSLRQALLDAHTASGGTINFAIPASDPNCVATGVCTIHLASGLPYVDRPMTIDGYTQTGASPNTDPTPMRSNAIIKVVIDGTGAVSGEGPGLLVMGSGSVIRGLAIDNIPGNVYGGILVEGDANVITGNFVGVDASGTLARGNGANGIRIAASGNRVGGPAPADRNVIGGNATNGIALEGSSNIVQGNVIGAKKGGTGSLPNGQSGISVQGGSGNMIGGLAAGEGNLAAFATATDVGGIDLFDTTGNTIEGNQVFFNAGVGISLSGATGNTLDGNVVVGNGLFGSHTYGGIALDYSNSIDSPSTVSYSSGNIVRNNFVGTDPAGDQQGNYGPGIFGRSSSNQILSNTIAYNTHEGILLPAGYTETLMSENRIFGNVLLGIDLSQGVFAGDGVTPNDTGDTDSGTNNRQNYPVLSAVGGSGSSTVITGTLAEDPNTSYQVEFFASSSCSDSLRQGQNFLGAQTVQTGADGVVSFTVTLPHAAPFGEFVTATGTDPISDTSEFSACQLLPAPFSLYLPLVRR